MFNHIQTRSSNLPKLAQSQETSAVTTDGNVPQRPIVFPSKKKKKKQKTPADLAVEEQKEDPEDFQFQEDPLETSMDDHVAADNGSLQGLFSAMFGNCAGLIEMACGGTNTLHSQNPHQNHASVRKPQHHQQMHHQQMHQHPYQPPLQAPPMHYADPYTSSNPPPILLNDPNHPPVNHMQPFNAHPQQPHYATQHYHVAPEPPPLSIADELRALAARTGIPLMMPSQRSNRDIPQFLGEDQLDDDDNISAISAHTLEEMVARSQGKLALHPLSHKAQQKRLRQAQQQQQQSKQQQQPQSATHPTRSKSLPDPPTKSVIPNTTTTTLSVQSSLNDNDYYNDDDVGELTEDDDEEPPSPTRTGSSSSGGQQPHQQQRLH